MTTEKAQCLLAYLGYYTLRNSKGLLAIDGIEGRAMTEAVLNFQADHYIQSSGKVDEVTAEALKDAVPRDEPLEEYPPEVPEWDSDDVFSKHFQKSEFKCQCGGRYCNGYPAEISPALVETLENIREHFGRPVTITSGLRCAQHNANVGGVSNSQHLYGTAADIIVSGVNPAKVSEYADQLIGDGGGVGTYGSFTHVDVRGHRARWRG